jgi:hypothetical protein
MYNFNELLIDMMITEDIYDGTMDNDEVRDEYTGERWYVCPHTGELTEAIYME